MFTARLDLLGQSEQAGAVPASRQAMPRDELPGCKEYAAQARYRLLLGDMVTKMTLGVVNEDLVRLSASLVRSGVR